MAAIGTRAFDAEVALALGALGAGGADRALDGLADPAGAARALADRDGEPILLRAAPELGGGTGAADRLGSASAGAGDGFGPTPADPVWLRIEDGQLRVAPLRAAAKAEAEAHAAARVVVEARRLPCCDAAGCDRERTHAAAWLVLAGGGAPSERRRAAPRRLLVAEARSLDAAHAEGVVEAVAAKLARELGAPLETAHGTEPADAIAPRPLPERDEDEAPPLAAAALARFAMRTEGEPAVLRDHASAGPRASLKRNLLVGFLLVAAALPLWILTAQSATAGDHGLAIGLGAGAMLLSLAGYAFLGVARFSARYMARSDPLVWLARDRFVVGPWKSRAGAIDRKPEGRFGAAIAIGELRGVQARARDDRWAVELDTEHGPIDALGTPSEEVARYWSRAIAQAAASVRHPGGPSAKQRLRARAQAESGAAAKPAAPARGST